MIMNTKPEASKIAELRSKTDRQLVILITSRLNHGIYCARLAGEAESGWFSAESSQSSAASAYDEVRALLPLVGEISTAERRRLEEKFEDLRRLLDESTIHAEMRIQTACS